MRLGFGQVALGGGFFCFEPLAPFLQGHEIGRRPIARGRQGAPFSREALGLRLRLGELGREPVGAAAQLDLALAQLARAPHQVDALRGQSRLLQAERLGVIALEGEGGAMALERCLELRRRAQLLRGLRAMGLHK